MMPVLVLTPGDLIATAVIGLMVLLFGVALFAGAVQRRIKKWRSR